MPDNANVIALGNNSLPVLAEHIRSYHRASENAKTESVQHAIKAGQALKEAKTLVIRTGGSWLVWIKNNCEFSERTAQIYMRLANTKYETAVSYLNLRNANKALAQPKPKEPARPPQNPAGTATKGRMKSKRRAPGSVPLKQNFIPNIPGYLEEMLLTMERCVIEYEMPPIDIAAKAIIAHRIKLEHFNEIITWLTQLKHEVHNKQENQCVKIS